MFFWAICDKIVIGHMTTLNNQSLLQTPRSKKATLGIFLVIFLQVVLICLALTALIGSIVLAQFDRVRVDGASMNPTLRHEQVLLMRSTPEINRGDIIVFPDLDSNGNQIYDRYNNPVNLIKRVVAIGGDAIQFRQDAATRTIFLYLSTNGGEFYRQDEDFILNNSMSHSFTNRPYFTLNTTYPIAESQVFVLGDNRNNSRDSRDIGSIPNEIIIARAIVLPSFLDRVVNWLS